MRFDYLIDDSERSLSPFFSPPVLYMVVNYIWIIGAILALAWPQGELFSFIQGHNIPKNFLSASVGMLLISSYLNLRLGRGEIGRKDNLFRVGREGLITFEEENDFLVYGFVQSLLHTAFFILLLFPLLIFAASVSGLSHSEFVKVLSILFTASLLCRLFSFFIFLLLGRWSRLGYILTRSFYLLFFFATAFFAPFVNPIRIIYAFYLGETRSSGLLPGPYALYMVITLSAALGLTLANHTLIRRNRYKGITA